VPEDKTFRPRMGYLKINLVMMVILAGMLVYFYITILSFGETFGGLPPEMHLTMILNILIVLGIPVLFLSVFFIRIKFILKNDRLIVRRYFRTIEIPYQSIKSVEEVSDRSVYLINFTPSAPSSKQVWIRYTDINGREEIVNFSPAKKMEFLSELKPRLPDPRVFNPGEQKKADVQYRKNKSLPLYVKLFYLVAVVVLVGTFIVIKLI